MYGINKLESFRNNIGWSTFLESTGVRHIDSVLVGQPEFLNH